MNHATEIYNLNIASGEMQQLSNANDDIYKDIKLSKIEKRLVKTTDGKEMVTWVIYPPDFDPNKSILLCSTAKAVLKVLCSILLLSLEFSINGRSRLHCGCS